MHMSSVSGSRNEHVFHLLSSVYAAIDILLRSLFLSLHALLMSLMAPPVFAQAQFCFIQVLFSIPVLASILSGFSPIVLFCFFFFLYQLSSVAFP